MVALLRRSGWLSLLALLTAAAPAAGQWLPNGFPVCTVSGNQNSPAIVPDFSGGAIVFWEDSRAGLTHIYAQRLTASGVPLWSPNGVMVSDPGFASFTPVAVADGFGGAIIAYSELHSTFDVYARKIASTGATLWSAPVCTAAGQQADVAIVSDFRSAETAPGPGAIITWTDQRAGNQDVYAQAVTGDGLVRWTADGVAIRTAASQEINPIIVTDGVGSITQPKGAFVAWHSTAGDFDVLAQHLNSAGAALWAADGVVIDGGAGNQLNPAAAYVGPGAAIIAWSDQAAVGSAVHAQRIGTGGWAPGGVQVCPVGVGGGEIQVLGDGTGGVIIGWSDFRAGNQDIYVQRLGGDGNRRWATNGVPVAVASDYQGNCVMVTDLAGGAIVIWRDDQPNLVMRDLYAQRIDSSGVARWSGGGVPVSLGNGDKIDPVVCGDGVGGAIVAWTDFRNTSGDGGNNRDVFAQRVSATGASLAVEAPRPATFRLLAPAPNPARGRLDVRFELPTARAVTADVLSVDGRHVATLAAGAEFPAGAASMRWDVRGPQGERVPSGVYFIRVRAGAESMTRRALIVR